MPLIIIKYDEKKVLADYFREPEFLLIPLSIVAAQALSCEEGGALRPEDIMIELSPHGFHDLNVKQIHVRVYAHDYPSRRERLDDIRKAIAQPLTTRFSEDYREGHWPSWYVWVLLSQTSYGSDTEG